MGRNARSAGALMKVALKIEEMTDLIRESRHIPCTRDVLQPPSRFGLRRTGTG
jgi:hypothetical protein